MSRLILLSLAQFMVVLDVTVVNVALPSIGADLAFAPDDLQWVVTAYVLMTGGLLLLGGRMADLLGRRRMFLTGLAVFTAASLASGLASSPGLLVAARTAQGIGAALLSPAALSIITTTFHGAARTRALSIWGAIGAGGAAAGVLLGGVLTSWLGCEAIFFINVPVGIVAAAWTPRLVRRDGPVQGALGRLDLPGALAAVAGLIALVYGIERTDVLPVLLAAGLLSLFAVIERGSRHPLVPPATWRVRSLVASGSMMLGGTGLLVGAFFLNSLFLQQTLGWSALETGVAFLPLVIVVGLAAHIGPHLLAHAGARLVVVIGLVLVGAGNLLLAAAPSDASYVADLLPGFVALGFGIGLVFVSVSVTAMADIDAPRAGLASGLMTTAHEIGAALGVALFSAIAVGGDGYADGSYAAAALAGTLALAALVTVPAFRPSSAQHATLH
jgi:EmrB/QacA subfamily drug resistance transporter